MSFRTATTAFSPRHSTGSVPPMCRNITTLRGLEPPATATEIEAAALQYVRKVSGVQKPSEAIAAVVADAVQAVAEATAVLLSQLPPRKAPPPTLPPLRRPAVRARLGLSEERA